MFWVKGKNYFDDELFKSNYSESLRQLRTVVIHWPSKVLPLVRRVENSFLHVTSIELQYFS